uniref:ecto-NOX disulfide-thiol exchanger 1-like n=1 Tax=Monopterus albus TaxID=43700 RepID=UPI0009B39DF3|nr:ecto-NOX disulfide-thiol exchanger 1-like [Monopterus albus]
MAFSSAVSYFDPSLGLMNGIAPINPMMVWAWCSLPSLRAFQLSEKSPTTGAVRCFLHIPASLRDVMVFIGGLLENSTERLIMELSGHCGDVAAIRRSKKTFSDIRFAGERTRFLCVHPALSLCSSTSSPQVEEE